MSDCLEEMRRIPVGPLGAAQQIDEVGEQVCSASAQGGMRLQQLRENRDRQIPHTARGFVELANY